MIWRRSIKLPAALLLAASAVNATLYDISGVRYNRWPGSAGRYFSGVGGAELEPIVITGGPGPVLTEFEVLPSNSRSHALARSVVTTSSDPDAALQNPGVLGHLETWTLRLGGKPPSPFGRERKDPWAWFPVAAASWWPLAKLPLLADLHPVVGVSGSVWLYPEIPIWDPEQIWPFLGLSNSWDLNLATHFGVKLNNVLGVGLSVRVIHSHLLDDWVFERMPQLGIDHLRGTTVAADIGALYIPSRSLSAGLSLTSLSPGMRYTTAAHREPLPTTLRAGVCYTTPAWGPIKLTAPVQFEWLIPKRTDSNGGGNWSTAGEAPTFTMLDENYLSGLQSAGGVELTVLDVCWLRLGYFEDVSASRGGLLVVDDTGATRRVGIIRAIADPSISEFKAASFTWGVGLGYRDYIRFDYSSDHNTTDCRRNGWTFSLTAQPSRIASLFRKS